MEDELDALVRAVLSSPKYRGVCPDLVRRLGKVELSRRRSLREATKRTRSRLHQIGAAYLEGGRARLPDLALLRAAYASGDRARIREASAEVLRCHSSTRERLPILDRVFSEALGGIGPVGSVLDVACGLNPVALPWMPVGRDVEYRAWDVQGELVDYLEGFFGFAHERGEAALVDVTGTLPDHEADVALVLKALPCLEHVERGDGERLLGALRAPYLLVSFPVRSLGGRAKGMEESYEAAFGRLVEARGWRAEVFRYPTELVFLVRK